MKVAFALLFLIGFVAISQAEPAFGLPDFSNIQGVIDKAVADLKGIADKLPKPTLPLPLPKLPLPKLPFPSFPSKAPAAATAPAAAPAPAPSA